MPNQNFVPAHMVLSTHVEIVFATICRNTLDIHSSRCTSWQEICIYSHWSGERILVWSQNERSPDLLTHIYSSVFHMYRVLLVLLCPTVEVRCICYVNPISM